MLHWSLDNGRKIPMTPLKRSPDWREFFSESFHLESARYSFEQKILSLEEYGKNPQYGVYFEVDKTSTKWYIIKWYLDVDLCRTPEDYSEMSRHPIKEVRRAAIMLSDCPKKVLIDVLKTIEFMSFEVKDLGLGRFGPSRSFNDKECDYLVAKAAIFSLEGFPRSLNS